MNKELIKEVEELLKEIAETHRYSMSRIYRRYNKATQKPAIIGHVDIIDCVENHSSVWALPNHYHWVLANPVLFEHPIEDVKGKLSLWDCGEYLCVPDHISTNGPLSEETAKLLQKVVRQAYKTK